MNQHSPDHALLCKAHNALAHQHKIDELILIATHYSQQSRSKRTRKEYAADWRLFCSWCQTHHFKTLPTSPQVVALYLSEHAGKHKTATLQRRMVAIRQMHTAAGFELDLKPIQEVWKGIRRTHGTAQKGKKPLVTSDLRALLQLLPQDMRGYRDKALLLIGFAGALRRSELVSLDCEHLIWQQDGIAIELKKSKTDQEQIGRQIGIPFGSNPQTCPLRAMQDWQQISGIESGPLFRGINRHGTILGRLCGKSVALILKRAAYCWALAQGFNLEQAAAHTLELAGHSLRAGLVTSAAQAGVAEHLIMRQTGHKKATPYANTYVWDRFLKTMPRATLDYNFLFKSAFL